MLTLTNLARDGVGAQSSAGGRKVALAWWLSVIASRQIVARVLLLLAAALPVLAPPVLAQGAAATASTDTAPDPVARAIVEKADEIRFPREAYQVDVSIVTTSQGEAVDEYRYRVLSKGNEKTIVMLTEPAAERGQVMLMRGRELWVYLPSVSQPVRLSLSQRLNGQVANGDLARANFSGDYVPKILRTDTIGGEPHHVLELTAVDRGVTYQRVLFWVRKSNGFPYRAEFYSTSGRLLKTCLYENFQRIGGRVRPTRLVMEDARRKGEVSVLEYSDIVPRDLPDRMFTKNYMKRLQ